MVDISKNMYEKNVIETMVDNDGILLLNDKHTKEGLNPNNLRKITTKYLSDHRKPKYKLLDEPKSNPIEFL